MSHKGKLRRGEAWWDNRDRDGKLPDNIANDPGKMCDVNYFLEDQKKESPSTPKPKLKEKK